ncbi:MAG: polysaccharide biosynthesis C-terminal domain-containing protein [Synergistaceae bacterium]|nr:polysaccharide biosynthesis C-terminal domain-containing protein [Synergistaceae bacterium]
MGKIKHLDEQVISYAFMKSAGVMIAACITAFIGTTVDSLVTSRYLGVEYITAFQLVQPTMLIVVVMFTLISNGIQNVYSRFVGAGKMEDAHKIMSLSMIILGIFGVAFAVAGCAFIHPIVEALGAEDPSSLLHKEAAAYFKGIAPGIVWLCLQQLFSYLLMMEGRHGVVLWAVVILTIVNIVGDLLVAFYFHSGLLGMGLASALCYFTGTAIMALSLIMKPGNFRFKLHGLKFRPFLDVLVMGVPGAVSRFCMVVQTTFMNKLLIHRFSGEAVAAYAILSTLNQLFQSVVIGIAGTTFTMASIYAGEEDIKSLRSTLAVSIRHSLIFELLEMACIMSFAHRIVAPFIGADGAVVEKIAVFGLRNIALALPLYGINYVFQRYAHALGLMKAALIIPLLNGMVMFISAAFVLFNWFGKNNVWFAFAISELLTMAIIFIAMSISRKHLAVKLDDYLCIPEGMGKDIEAKLEVSVASMDDLMNLSQNVQGVCLKYGVEARKALLLALSVEEMGKNIFQYNTKAMSIDFRMLKKADYFIIRIRDSGQEFSPKKWLELHGATNSEDNIGIRLVSGMAQKFEYISTMGMNNLLIYV